MQCGKDVTIKSWVPWILTIARESWGGGQAFDRQQRCCLVFRAGPQTRCAFPGFTHTVHCSENPLQTTQHVIHNRLKYIPGKHSNKSMAQAYTPFVGPCFQHKIKGKGREYKGNKSSKQTSRRKQEGSHSLPPPIYKMQQKLGEAKNRNVCHKNVQVWFRHARITAKPELPFWTNIFWEKPEPEKYFISTPQIREYQCSLLCTTGVL